MVRIAIEGIRESHGTARNAQAFCSCQVGLHRGPYAHRLLMFLCIEGTIHIELQTAQCLFKFVFVEGPMHIHVYMHTLVDCACLLGGLLTESSAIFEMQQN